MKTKIFLQTGLDRPFGDLPDEAGQEMLLADLSGLKLWNSVWSGEEQQECL
jgi:hypothetical protein